MIKFGPEFARRLNRNYPGFGDTYYLDEVFLKIHDKQHYLRRSIREHAMFFLYGPGGNGKGTFLNTLQHVLQDYATVASMETFTESHSERHPTDLAMLRGAR